MQLKKYKQEQVGTILFLFIYFLIYLFIQPSFLRYGRKLKDFFRKYFQIWPYNLSFHWWIVRRLTFWVSSMSLHLTDALLNASFVTTSGDTATNRNIASCFRAALICTRTRHEFVKHRVDQVSIKKCQAFLLATRCVKASYKLPLIYIYTSLYASDF